MVTKWALSECSSLPGKKPNFQIVERKPRKWREQYVRAERNEEVKERGMDGREVRRKAKSKWEAESRNRKDRHNMRMGGGGVERGKRGSGRRGGWKVGKSQRKREAGRESGHSSRPLETHAHWIQDNSFKTPTPLCPTAPLSVSAIVTKWPGHI